MLKGKDLLKTKDVAHILDCSPDDVIVLAKNDKLKGTKRGKFWCFRYEDIETYRKRHQKK